MTPQKLAPPTWVATKEALNSMIAVLEKEPSIAVDTESNSLYAYQEQVCLIQFSTPTEDFLLDPLTLPDLSNLAPLFANPDIEKIFHAAEYDLICLERDFAFKFNHIFDTMIAARILGYKAVGLGKLLDEKFNVKVDKKFQKANWGKRPLSNEMLNYARLDTHHLIELRKILKAELVNAGLWQLAQEDFEMATIVNGNHSRLQVAIWERVGGRTKLDPRQATVLNAVCQTREELAAKMNRPTFKVVSNKLLVRLAEETPRNHDELAQSGMTQHQIRRFGKLFLRAIKRGLQADLVKPTRHPRPSDAYLLRVDKLRNWRKEKAKQIGVESDIVLPRTLMEGIAKENPRNQSELGDVMNKSPWRLQEYGAEILKRIR